MRLWCLVFSQTDEPLCSYRFHRHHHHHHCNYTVSLPCKRDVRIFLEGAEKSSFSPVLGGVAKMEVTVTGICAPLAAQRRPRLDLSIWAEPETALSPTLRLPGSEFFPLDAEKPCSRPALPSGAALPDKQGCFLEPEVKGASPWDRLRQATTRPSLQGKDYSFHFCPSAPGAWE